MISQLDFGDIPVDQEPCAHKHELQFWRIAAYGSLSVRCQGLNSGSRCLQVAGDAHCHFCAVANLAADHQRAAMQFNEGARNGEAEAGAAFAFGELVFHLLAPADSIAVLWCSAIG